MIVGESIVRSILTDFKFINFAQNVAHGYLQYDLL